MHNYSKMNRRSSRFTPIFSFMGAVLLMGYGYYIYTNQSSEILTAHDNLDKCNGNRKVLKEQLKGMNCVLLLNHVSIVLLDFVVSWRIM